MKILFLTDNFPPEVNAPATRTYEHCREWVKQGVDVKIITCVPNFPFGKTYEGYRNKFFQKEDIDGIEVLRVWSFMAPNKGFILRTLDFMSFSIMSFFVGLFQSTDIIMATSPQFFTALSGRALSIIKRKKYVLEIRDLWPEQILASTNIKRNFLIKYFEWIELKCYKRANLIVTVTDTFVQKIRNRGIKKEKFVVIKNGVDNRFFKPLGKNVNLIEKYNLKGKLVVGYIGTHGLSQNLLFVIESINEFNKLNYPEETHFLFVGEGAEKQLIIEKAQQLKIDNITFVGQVAKARMPEYLSLLDISIVPLKKSDLYLSVLPSKIFEHAAMNIPILLGVDGEARKLIEQYKCGLYYAPEDKESFIKQLTKLIKGKEKLVPELKKGSKNLADDFSREVLAERLLNNIKTLI